jgi:hypothetical protein
MLPSIEPGLGIGVLVGASITVAVGVTVIVNVAFGEKAAVAVFVGRSVVADVVGEASGTCCAVAGANAVKVNATFVATMSGLVTSGVLTLGILHAPRDDTNRTKTNFFKGPCIDHPP